MLSDSDCSAEEYVIREPILMGKRSENIREKAMIKNWNLAELCQKGVKYESAAAGEEKMSGSKVNKVGAYSYQRIRNEKKTPHKKCYRCDSPFSTKYIKEFKALKTNCGNCNKIGHFAKVCQQTNVNRVNNTVEQEDGSQERTEMETYQLNISNVQLLNSLPKFTAVKKDFKKNLLVNSRLVKMLIDTGAKVFVCRKFMTK